MFIQLFVQMANIVKTVLPVYFFLGLFWLANAEEVHLLFSLSWLDLGFYGFYFVCPAKCENKHAVMAWILHISICVQNIWYHSESWNQQWTKKIENIDRPELVWHCLWRVICHLHGLVPQHQNPGKSTVHWAVKQRNIINQYCIQVFFSRFYSQFNIFLIWEIKLSIYMY